MARKKEAQLFLAIVRQEESTSILKKKKLKHEKDIQNLLIQFQDVFPKELPGLPPLREIQHKIELIPGSSPPCRPPYRLSIE
jgi:hypothetical protein